MEINTINAALFAKMFLAGAKNLESKKEWINELNVFPVPDGDTGTNMTMTIMAAAKEVAALEDPTMEVLAKAISSGSLRGARGNSGVILSQLFRGFTKGIKKYEEIDVAILAAAFQKAVETAYKAVMKPKEGTILTVAKGAADKALELAENDISLDDFLKQVIEEADAVLAKTPEMLPVLKEAGVVDSGGQGLVQVLKGAYDAFLGKEIDYTVEPAESTKKAPAQEKEAPAQAEIRFGYCTEFIIMLEKEYTPQTEQEFKGFLESIGDSIVVVSDDDIVKVHVHTNDPGLAIQKALTFGSLSRMKIDNMREEHQERVIQDAERKAAEQKAEEENAEAAKHEPRKAYGFIAVSVGDGLGEIFKGIGADYLIEGGQTMNPSTEDMVNAIEHVNADTVYILPNNKNIILAAEQAKYLVEDKQIIVVPSKTVPQGITALINFIPDQTPEENLAAMVEEMGRVKTGQITYAVRNTVIDDMEIHEGDIMGIGDHGMLAVSTSLEKATIDTLKAMLDEDSELVTVYYGSDVSAADAQALTAKLQESCPDVEIELQEGGQPIYYYLISVE